MLQPNMQPVICLLRKFPPGAYRAAELETFISSAFVGGEDPILDGPVSGGWVRNNDSRQGAKG